jgi:small subunit ribosomal protein S16
VLEELGTYDPLVPETDARVMLNGERVNYWLGVGAQPSPKVKVLIRKYGAAGTHLTEMNAARERLAMPKIVPPAGEPAYVPPPPSSPESQAQAAEGATEQASGQESSEQASSEQASSEQSGGESTATE